MAIIDFSEVDYESYIMIMHSQKCESGAAGGNKQLGHIA